MGRKVLHLCLVRSFYCFKNKKKTYFLQLSLLANGLLLGRGIVIEKPCLFCEYKKMSFWQCVKRTIIGLLDSAAASSFYSFCSTREELNEKVVPMSLISRINLLNEHLVSKSFLTTALLFKNPFKESTTHLKS
jgi:hypothetical protein